MNLISIEEQLKMLDKMITKAENSLKKAPKGFVNVECNRGADQYYYKESLSEKRGKYLPKEKRALAAALVQRDYDKAFLAAANKEKRILLQFKKHGGERNISFLYTSLNDVYERAVSGRKKLIKPYLLTNDQFVKEWESVEYQGLQFAVGAQEIFSEKGERVRSKSEKMIADKLFLMKIPYRYEYPLDIGRRNLIYPDFTILDIRERRTVIFEHFGMMQDSQYAYDALNKIRNYQKAGFKVGENFLYTMESQDSPLDMRMFEKMMRDRFL